MKMHIDKVYSCAFSSDGKWIISGGNKGKAIIWDNRGAFSKYLAKLYKPINDIAITGDNVIVSADKGYLYSIANTSNKNVPIYSRMNER